MFSEVNLRDTRNFATKPTPNAEKTLITTRIKAPKTKIEKFDKVYLSLGYMSTIVN